MHHLAKLTLGALGAIVVSCHVAPTTRTPATSLASTAPCAPVPEEKAPVDPSGDWEIRWDRTFAGWQPAIFDGTLSLRREAERWTATLQFKQSVSHLTFASLSIEGDHIDLVFRGDTERSDSDDLHFSGWLREDRIIGEISWGALKWTPAAARRTTLATLKRGSVDHSLPKTDLADDSIDQAALKTLIERATSEHSSALVIARDGKIGVEMYREGQDGRPIYAMSASKSVVSLAIGMLIADGKIKLDTTMGSLFPSWKSQGDKAKITVQQLLSHTSGLDPVRTLWASESIRERSERAKLLFPPGTRFQYNNAAVDFLCLVFEKAAGEGIDTYLERRLFKKLDMVGATWMKDKEGVARGAGELAIRPVDLVKIGQLMLDGGVWQGERIVPAEWIERSVAASQPFNETCGLLWWREGKASIVLIESVIASWRDAGIDSVSLQRAHSLLGKRFSAWADYQSALVSEIGAAAFQQLESLGKQRDHFAFSTRVLDGPALGFSAQGWLGQYLVVLPRSRIVAVRMRTSEPKDYDYEPGRGQHGYSGFSTDVAALPR